VVGTRNVLELMQELKIPKGVYTSTVAVYSDIHGKLVDETYHYNGPFLSEYDRTKWLAHYEVAEPLMTQGLPLVIVQPGLVYGPGDASIVRTSLIQYLQRKLPMVPQKTAFCWVHVEDIALAHIQAMEKGRPGESYIISGPPHTFIEALEVSEQLTGIPVPRLRVSPGMMRTMSRMMGVLEKFLPLPVQFTAEMLRVLVGVTYLARDDKARQGLGFDPRPLELGMKETLEYEMELMGKEYIAGWGFLRMTGLQIMKIA
jgi:nucleoside-diphosphate-sugar epimerase